MRGPASSAERRSRQPKPRLSPDGQVAARRHSENHGVSRPPGPSEEFAPVRPPLDPEKRMTNEPWSRSARLAGAGALSPLARVGKRPKDRPGQHPFARRPGVAKPQPVKAGLGNGIGACAHPAQDKARQPERRVA